MTLNNKLNLLGQKFGRLTVIEETLERKGGCVVWICQCNCDDNKFVEVRSGKLTSGYTQSCGCLQRERTSLANKEYNTYDFSNNDYITGFTTKNEEFYFSYNDFDLVKEHCVYFSVGYPITWSSKLKKHIMMHNLIMNIFEEDGIHEVDHKDRNPKNFRRENLRIATHLENMKNQSLSKANTSGVIGVGVGKNKKESYFSQIVVNDEHFWLGSYPTFYEAVQARLIAEKEYFGEFAPQRHLFKEYDIEEN